MAKTIGIDLGTANSCAAVIKDGVPTVIPNAEGARITPCVVTFDEKNNRTVGRTAKQQAFTNPNRAILSFKQHMGSSSRFTINNKSYTPQEASAMVLQKLKADAEAYLGEEVTEAVITVPASFTNAQRQATIDAGKIAGLKIKRVISEPTAVGLAYSFDKSINQKIVVCNLGGSNFDASVVEIGNGILEVLATAGNNWLGGEAFDQKIVDWIVESFKQTNGIDLRDNKTAMLRIKDAAEKAKIELSSVSSSSISLPFITVDASGPKNLEMTLTRAKFNEITSSLVRFIVNIVRQAIKESAFKESAIDKILLVGGSSRIPAVQEAIGINFGKVPFMGLNTDESAAVGAAVQAGILNGDVKGTLVLEVTPFSLGIETMGGACTKIIQRNSTIPVKKKQVFTTASDNQSSVEVHVIQGESRIAAENETIGIFHLDGIRPAKRGVPQIEVSFELDTNGIINVSAKDLDTGRVQTITVTSSSNMSETDIKRAIINIGACEQQNNNAKPNSGTGRTIPQPVIPVKKDDDKFRRPPQNRSKENADNEAARILTEFLPVLDNFERASDNVMGSFEDYKLGIDLIQKQLINVFVKLNVEVFAEPGEQFDPNIHSAVMHINDDTLGENVITDVFSKGYKMGDKILRHATVKVAN